jgi:hypothetical protein
MSANNVQALPGTPDEMWLWLVRVMVVVLVVCGWA